MCLPYAPNVLLSLFVGFRPSPFSPTPQSLTPAPAGLVMDSQAVGDLRSSGWNWFIVIAVEAVVTWGNGGWVTCLAAALLTRGRDGKGRFARQLMGGWLSKVVTCSVPAAKAGKSKMQHCFGR